MTQVGGGPGDGKPSEIWLSSRGVMFFREPYFLDNGRQYERRHRFEIEKVKFDFIERATKALIKIARESSFDLEHYIEGHQQENVLFIQYGSEKFIVDKQTEPAGTLSEGLVKVLLDYARNRARSGGVIFENYYEDDWHPDGLINAESVWGLMRAKLEDAERSKANKR